MYDKITMYLSLFQNFDGTVTALQEVKENNYTRDLKQALVGDFNQLNKLEEVDADANFTTFILDEVGQITILSVFGLASIK